MRNARAFQALTGMKLPEFNKLAKTFEREEHKQERERIKTMNRKRAPGAGRRRVLASVESRLLFILAYFHCYPTQDLQGVLFGVTQPVANDWIHRLTLVLEKALGRRMELPLRPPKSTIRQLLVACPELAFIIDGTERPMQRPKNSKRQEKCYSGKKKRHGMKNTIVTSMSSKRVVFLGQTREGSVHDKKLADEDKPPFPPGSLLWQDTGYQGYQPDNVIVLQPTKRSKNHELSEGEKSANHHISSIRVGVENAIAGVKRSRIVHDIYRNRKPGFDDRSMVVSCGIYNYLNSCRSKSAA